MGEARIFAPHERLELMEGEIIEMAPIGSAHAAIVNALAALFNRASDRFVVSVQNPLILDDRSAPQPDLALLKLRQDNYYSAHPAASDALLLVEVSDRTLSFDIDIKLPMYARANVQEVWVVDVERQAIHVFREPREDRYEIRLMCTGDDEVSPSRSNGIALPVSTLFRT
jgi:Uma2 family endonuclease